MKVYIHLLSLVFLSVMLTGCMGDKDTVEYTIENSGGVTSFSGSVSLEDGANIAYINQFSGGVMIDEMIATSGAIIHENSLLVTGSGAEVEIIFADNSIVRLSSNSRLQISHRGPGNTSLNLQEGTLWARVLKPFSDLSFFTLETSDLSAGVRGTSVWLMTDSGGTDIGVVDTTSTGGQVAGAIVDIQDKISYGSGSIHLSLEDILRVRHSHPLEHKKMSLREQIKMHSFIGINTVRDIGYMNSLMEKYTSQTGTGDRIHKEMDVTMPSSDEVPLFLMDSIIRSELKDIKNRDLTPTKFIYYLDLDEKIKKIRDSKVPEIEKNTSIESIRKTLLTPSLPEKTTPPPSPTKTPSTTSSLSTQIRVSVSGEKLPCIPKVSGEPCTR